MCRLLPERGTNWVYSADLDRLSASTRLSASGRRYDPDIARTRVGRVGGREARRRDEEGTGGAAAVHLDRVRGGPEAVVATPMTGTASRADRREFPFVERAGAVRGHLVDVHDVHAVDRGKRALR
jgi:hypothetical protein